MKGFFSGLASGFGLFLVFGLLASLTSASSITNLFGILGILCLFGCPIIGFIDGRKARSGQRKLKADEQSRAASIEKSMKEVLATMNLGCGVTQETFKRYANACEDLIYFCNEYMSHPLYGRIVEPYRHAIYERTWPVYRWNSRTYMYEYVPGIELADVLHEEMEKKIQEFKARHNIT